MIILIQRSTFKPDVEFDPYKWAKNKGYEVLSGFQPSEGGPSLDAQVVAAGRAEIEQALQADGLWSPEDEEPIAFVAGTRTSARDGDRQEAEVESNVDDLYDGDSAAARQSYALMNPETQKEQFLAKMEDAVGKDLFKLWFDPDSEKDFDKVLADFTSKEAWDNILDRHKKGELTNDQVRDLLVLSHMRVGQQRDETTKVDPKEILQREVRSQLKGKVGQKILGAFAEAAQSAGIMALPAQKIHEQMLMLGNGAESEAGEAEPVKPVEEIEEEIKTGMVAVANEKFEESLGFRHVYDLEKEITFDALRAKLEDEMDPDFDLLRRAVIDINVERRGYVEDDKLYLTLYVMNLDKAYVMEGLSVDDRCIVKWIVTDTDPYLKHPKWDEFAALWALVGDRFRGHVLDKLEMVKTQIDRGEI